MLKKLNAKLIKFEQINFRILSGCLWFLKIYWYELVNKCISSLWGVEMLDCYFLSCEPKNFFVHTQIHWHGRFAHIFPFSQTVRTKYVLYYTHAIWMWKKLKQSTKFVFLFETHKSLVSICRLTRFASHVRSRENICHLFIEHFWG